MQRSSAIIFLLCSSLPGTTRVRPVPARNGHTTCAVKGEPLYNVAVQTMEQEGPCMVKVGLCEVVDRDRLVLYWSDEQESMPGLGGAVASGAWP